MKCITINKPWWSIDDLPWGDLLVCEYPVFGMSHAIMDLNPENDEATIIALFRCVEDADLFAKAYIKAKEEVQP